MTAGNQVWKDGKTPSDLWQIRGRLPWLFGGRGFFLIDGSLLEILVFSDG